MRQLENNGYYNVVGLKRRCAIEVDDYDEKENFLHTIFERSQVGKSELFSLDIEIVVQLLSSLDGDVVYPKKANKDDIFDEAVEQSRKTIDVIHRTKKDTLIVQIWCKTDRYYPDLYAHKDDIVCATSHLAGTISWDSKDEAKASRKAAVKRECTGNDGDDFGWAIEWTNALYPAIQNILLPDNSETAK